MSEIATAGAPVARKKIWEYVVLGWSFVIVMMQTGVPIVFALTDGVRPPVWQFVHISFGLLMLFALYLLIAENEDEQQSLSKDLATIGLWIGFLYQAALLAHQATTYTPPQQTLGQSLFFMGVMYGWMPPIVYLAMGRILEDVRFWRTFLSLGYRPMPGNTVPLLDPEPGTRELSWSAGDMELGSKHEPDGHQVGPFTVIDGGKSDQ